MGKKILKTLTNNIGFKLLALLFAVILWLVVYNVDDPIITRNYMTNVLLENENAVQDKYYEILDSTNNVTFSVSAKRSILDKIDDSDFHATADFNEMVVSEGGTKGTIKVDIVPNRYNSSLKFNGSSKFLYVSLEDAKSKQFVVLPTTEGEVADGYALGDVTISSSNVIKVSGPATVVGGISKVVAAINVDGMSQNLSDSVVPILYDDSGNEIDTTKLSLSRTTVTVSAIILGTKKVSLNFSTKGTPADGYAFAGMSAGLNSVWIKGATATINPISSIEIPSSVLDITGASENVETTINITDYLPSGVALLDTADANVSVKVEIEAYETRSFEIPVENITIEGLAVENELTFPQGVVVNITGLAGDLDEINVQTLRGNVDVTELSTGSHVVSVELDIDVSKFVVAMSRTQINIDIKQDNPEIGEGEGNEDTTIPETPENTDETENQDEGDNTPVDDSLTDNNEN